MITDQSLSTERTARQAWVADQEEAIARLTREALRMVVLEAYEAFLGTLTASGDLSALDTIPTRWLSVVDDRIIPALGETYLAGSVTAWLGLPADKQNTAFAAQWQNVVNENAVSYMEQATNRLRGVGDNVWRDVRSQTTSGIAQGKTVDELRADIQGLTGFSERRAETIARTETIGAYVQGDMAGARALGANAPVEKVWVAAIDARTRDTHIAAHNQVVAFDADFTVGGVQMDAPHAPGAPAAEVVNCRCICELLYAGDTRPDGSKVGEQPDELAVAREVALPPAPAPVYQPKVMPKKLALDNSGRDDDWRTTTDPEIRAAAVWQHQYGTMRAVRRAERNLRLGRPALEGVELDDLTVRRMGMVPDFDNLTGRADPTTGYVELLTRDDLMAEVENAARVLRKRLDNGENNFALVRGMRVDDLSQFQEGQVIELDVTSFTSDQREAALYNRENTEYTPGEYRVFVHLAPGAKTANLKPIATGGMSESKEHIYQGNIRVTAIKEDKGATHVYAEAINP
jgi:hypothetical protein